MVTGILPDEWKTSTVSVLFKKGKKDSIENYRPISLTCICCKIMESVVRDHVMEYFSVNNLFSNKQYGFIKGRSTVLQLLKVTDDWVKALEEGGQIDIVYTDFEKAFDKISHQRLISKLHTYGLNDVVINWIQSFLFTRSQRVKINSTVSDSKSVLSGIPQGSVLGPLLFVIFINDLPQQCGELGEMFLFADDSKIYKHIKNANDFIALNQCCKNVYEWCDNWLMKLNISKCKILSICYNRNSIIKHDYGFNVSGHDFISLDHVDSIKDLGVVMDSGLSFDSHIYDKINMANKMLGIVKRNFQDLDKNSFILLYKGMVRCHLEFAVSVWNPYRIGLIEDIEKVQKRETKLIRECKGLDYKERLKFLNLPTLHYRRIRGDMIEVFKILNELYDVNVVPPIAKSLNNRTRGNSFKLQVVRCKYDIRKYSFCNRVVNVWNSLPDSVVNSGSVNMFKNSLDKFWKCESFFYDFKANPVGFV